MLSMAPLLNRNPDKNRHWYKIPRQGYLTRLNPKNMLNIRNLVRPWGEPTMNKDSCYEALFIF